jgi:Ca2+-dependent lipid-binding protein
VFGSDPYVDITTIDQDIRSEIIYNTLNPEWNETYDIIVYDRGSQTIEFSVFDFDMTNNTKLLGKAEFEVNKIPYNTQVQKTLMLTGVERGSLVVSCLYVPMAAVRTTQKTKKLKIPVSVFKTSATDGAGEGAEGEADVLFDLPMDELTSNETLLSGELALQTSFGGDGEDGSGGRHNMAAGAGLGILMVSGIKLRNLKVGASASWKPCVSFHVGVTSKQTRSRKNTVNPEFDERFAFIMKDQTAMERIQVKILDKNKLMSNSRQVGEVAVSLFDVLNAGGGVNGAPAAIEKEYKVESETIDCMVSFKMQWFSTTQGGRN